MLYIGSRYGGIGHGVISGIGLLVEVFVLRMPPAIAPVQVMLIIIAVVSCAAILEAADGLKFMLQIAERILRKNPKIITFLRTYGYLAFINHARYMSCRVIYHAYHR